MLWGQRGEMGKTQEFQINFFDSNWTDKYASFLKESKT